MQADSSQTTQAVCATRATRTFGIIGTTRPKQAPYGTLETHQQRPIMFIMFGFGLGFPRIFAVFVVFGDGCAFCPIATCQALAVPDLQTKQFTQPERQARLREPHFSDFSLSSSQSPKAKDQPKIQVSSFRPPSAKTTKSNA